MSEHETEPWVTAEMMEREDPAFSEDLRAARNRIRAARGDAPIPHPSDTTPARAGDLGVPVEAFTAALLERFGRRGVAPVPLTTPPDVYQRLRANSGDTRNAWYVPPRFAGVTSETFRPQNDTHVAALAAVRGWVAGVRSGGGPLLALTGSVGTGKSHLMYAAVRGLNHAGFHVGAWTWRELSDALRGRFDADGDNAETLSRFKRCQALAIDEIRATSGTDFDQDQLGGLLTEAYNQRRGVICTSNQGGERLVAMVGRAAYSRMTEVQVTGPDFRHLPHDEAA